MSRDAHDRSRRQFAPGADAYRASAIHASGTDLAAMVALAERRVGSLSGLRALDIATGAGHAALALARAGAEVTLGDLTPEMLASAGDLIRDTLGADTSVDLLEAPAEALPVADASFEIVSCRIAAHHFADPAAFVGEAARTLVPGGLLLLIDNIAPLDAELAATMNRIERRRDPSHVEAYGVAQWFTWLAEAGLDPVHLERFPRRKVFADWVARSRTPEADVAALERSILALPPPARSYFEVEERDGRLHALNHEAALIAALKPNRVRPFPPPRRR
jgi:ubiquinone/menaquinone biosynthesis C-methylase UbiE